MRCCAIGRSPRAILMRSSAPAAWGACGPRCVQTPPILWHYVNAKFQTRPAKSIGVVGRRPPVTVEDPLKLGIKPRKSPMPGA